MRSTIILWLFFAICLIKKATSATPACQPCQNVSCAPGYVATIDNCKCTECNLCNYTALGCGPVQCPQNFYLVGDSYGCTCPVCLPCTNLPQCPPLKCNSTQYEYQDPWTCNCPYCKLCEIASMECPKIGCTQNGNLVFDGCHCPRCSDCINPPQCGPLPQCDTGMYLFTDLDGCECPICVPCQGRVLECLDLACPPNEYQVPDPTGCNCSQCVPCDASNPNCGTPQCDPTVDPTCPCNLQLSDCPELSCPEYYYLETDITNCTCPSCVPCSQSDFCENINCDSGYLYIDRYSCKAECLPCPSKPLFCIDEISCPFNSYSLVDPTGCNCTVCASCPEQICACDEFEKYLASGPVVNTIDDCSCTMCNIALTN